jgi:hypothetical protein
MAAIHARIPMFTQDEQREAQVQPRPGAVAAGSPRHDCQGLPPPRGQRGDERVARREERGVHGGRSPGVVGARPPRQALRGRAPAYSVGRA